MRRSIFVVLVIVCLLASTTGVFAQEPPDLPPAILSLTAATAAFPLEQIEAGTATSVLSWHTINVSQEQQIRLYAYQLRTWVPVEPDDPDTQFPAIGEQEVTLLPPLNFGSPMFRLSIETVDGEVLDERLIAFDYADEAELAPQIEQFSATVTSISRLDLERGTARVGLGWRVLHRPANSNLRFEQVLEDGSTVSVELPRRTLWISSSSQTGVVAPVLTTGTSIHLRLSLIDLLTGNVYTQAETDVRIAASAPSQTSITTTVPLTAQLAQPTATLTDFPTSTLTPVIAAQTDFPTSVPALADAPIFVTGAADEGNNRYYAIPAACATIHWSFTGTDTVYITDPNGQLLGPFGASGELRTIPIHFDMHYTVYAGGQPGEVDGVDLVFNSPPSTQYPGNQGNGYIDPSCL